MIEILNIKNFTENSFKSKVKIIYKIDYELFDWEFSVKTKPPLPLLLWGAIIFSPLVHSWIKRRASSTLLDTINNGALPQKMTKNPILSVLWPTSLPYKEYQKSLLWYRKILNSHLFWLNSHPFFMCPIIICRLNLSVSAPPPWCLDENLLIKLWYIWKNTQI